MKNLFFSFVILFTISLSNAQHDSSLVEIVKINPRILLDMRYATENNFLKKAVYPEAKCFLRFEATRALSEVQKELETIGLGLKVFDGYRPLDVQRKMWEILPNPSYVADPKSGSRHNRGMAVDLTLVDKSGTPLPMPTEFDSFEKKAGHKYQALPDKVKLNRWILKTVMEKHGFKAISSEWWHYDYRGWRKYKVLDMPFDEIQNQQK